MDEVLRIVRAREVAADGTARRARIAAGLSLGEVATAVGATTSTVSRWESGERRPRGRLAVAYADLIDQLLAPRDAA